MSDIALVTALKAQKQAKLNASTILNRDYRGFGEITLPSDFAPKLPFSLYRDRDGVVKHNYDFTKFENYTKVLYCDSGVGSDSTGDGSTGNPFRSLKKSLQTASTLPDTNILIRVRGNQLRGNGGDDSAAQAITTITNKNISIVPDGAGKIAIASAQNTTGYTGLPALTWTADGTAWKTARSNTWNAFDLKNRDVFGLAKPLDYVATLAACQSTPNSWYTDGTSVWVNTFDSRQPDADILVCINICNFWVKMVGSTIYMRDLEFYSGFLSSAQVMAGSCFIQGDYTSKIITNKCNFAGGEGRDTGAATAYTNAFQFLDTKEIYMFNCIGGYARRDVFNHHFSNISPGIRRNCLVFEYNCIGYKAGIYGETTGNNNAFTCHEGASVLRVNPIGYDTKGPVCADVNGCYTIIIDGSMRDSKIGSQYDAAAAYYFDNVSATVPGKALLINSEGGSPKYSIYADAGFDVAIRNFLGKSIKNDVTLTYLK